METNFWYPPNLTFTSPGQANLAIELLPYAKAFFVGGILQEDEDSGWSNVFYHCLLEAQAVGILVDAIPHLGDKQNLQVAAFVHDAYKRREIEQLQADTQNGEMLYATDTESKEWLLSLGYPNEIVTLETAYGNNAALGIYRGEITDLTRRTLHYIDDICKGDEIVSLEERLTALERNPNYAESNEYSRQFFNGLTLYQAKRQINAQTEVELAQLVGVTEPKTLPSWINSQLA